MKFILKAALLLTAVNSSIASTDISLKFRSGHETTVELSEDSCKKIFSSAIKGYCKSAISTLNKPLTKGIIAGTLLFGGLAYIFLERHRPIVLDLEALYKSIDAK